MTFTTEKIDAEIEFDKIEYPSKAEIEWELEFERREWGIKDFNIIIHSIKINAILNDADKEIFPEMNLDFPHSQFEIKNCEPEKFGLPFYPSSLVISIEKREIEIYFN